MCPFREGQGCPRLTQEATEEGGAGRAREGAREGWGQRPSSQGGKKGTFLALASPNKLHPTGPLQASHRHESVQPYKHIPFTPFIFTRFIPLAVGLFSSSCFFPIPPLF